MTTAKTLYAKM